MNPLLTPLIPDIVLKSTALLLLAFALQTLRRRASAARRSFLWLAVFGVLGLLPLTLLATPRFALRWLPKPAAIKSTAPLPEIEATAVLPPRARPPAASPGTPRHPISAPEMLAALWLLGAALVLAHRWLGSLRLSLLERKVMPLESARIRRRTAELARECGVARAIDLRQSDLVPVPVTWGALRPVLLLPAASLGWVETRLDAALRHELGHIRHFDALSRIFAQVVCAVHWFNPLVWLAAKAWHTAQEQACDDLVLRAGSDAERYALQLLDAAQSLGASRRLPSPALAMARCSTLETRLSAIIDATRDRRPLSRLLRLSGAASGLLTLALSAALQIRAADMPAAKPDEGRKPGEKAARLIQIESKFIEISEGATGLDDPLLQRATLSAAEMEKLMQALGRGQGADVLSAPSITTRPGQAAKVEVVRDFAGPNGADTPDMKPADFDPRVGVTLDVEATLDATGGIFLKTTPMVRDFLGWKTEKSAPRQPVFFERKTHREGTLVAGEWMVCLLSEPPGAPTAGKRAWCFVTAALHDAKENPQGGGGKPVRRTIEEIQKSVAEDLALLTKDTIPDPEGKLHAKWADGYLQGYAEAASLEAGRRAREGAVSSAREKLEETRKVLSGVAHDHPEWKGEVEVRLQRIDDDLRQFDRKEAAGKPGSKGSGRDADAKWAPEDDYFKAYLLVNKAERLEQAGDTDSAMEELRKARQIINGIVRKFPSWQTEVVNFRLKKIKTALERLAGGSDLSRFGPDKLISQ